MTTVEREHVTEWPWALMHRKVTTNPPPVYRSAEAAPGTGLPRPPSSADAAQLTAADAAESVRFKKASFTEGDDAVLVFRFEAVGARHRHVGSFEVEVE